MVIASTTSSKSNALLPRDLGVKDHLEQQVAQFVPKVGEIAPLDGVRHLIGFLDGVGRNRREGLFEVPRATGARRAERRHDFDEAGDSEEGVTVGSVSRCRLHRPGMRAKASRAIWHIAVRDGTKFKPLLESPLERYTIT